MKQYAVTITSKENAELLEVGGMPELGPRQIRGRTICSLISPGTELAWAYCGSKFPTNPGYAAVFEADEVGSEHQNISKGTLFFCMGNHRSHQQVDLSDTVQVPDGLSPEKAVIARMVGISMTTLMTTTARPGDIVIVSGAGPVGYLAAQIFALSGYEVVVVDPDPGRREIVQASGGFRVLDKIQSDSGLAGKVALVVECSGHEQAVMDAASMVRRRGEVVLIGVPWQRRTERSAHELLSLVFHKYAVLRSGWEWEIPRRASEFSPHGLFEGYLTAMKWIQNGRIKVDGLTVMIDPRDAQKGYQDLLHKRSIGLFSTFDWRRIQDLS